MFDFAADELILCIADKWPHITGAIVFFEISIGILQEM